MKNAHSFQRMAGVTLVAASVLAVASLFVGLAGVDYNFDAFSGAEAILAAGAEAADYIRWSLILNLFGNYLLLTPAALLLWYWLRPHSPAFADFYTLGGLLFIFIGGIASGVLAAVWPDTISDYAAASAPQRDVLGAVFLNFTRAMENGLQGPVQNIPAALWLLGMGTLLKNERRALGYLTLLFGFFMFLNSLGGLVNHESLSMIGFSGNFLLHPIWALWLGIDLLRKPAMDS